MTPRKVNGLALVLAALFVAVMFTIMQRSGDADSGITWETNLAQATAQAKQAGKPVLISFHTPDCVYCAKMDATTFRDAKVQALAKQFICVRLDRATDPQATDAAKVSEFPTTVFLNSQGRETLRVPGYIAPDRFAAALNTFLSTK